VKIAFLVRSVPPALDGVGDYTSHLAAALREMDVDARIVTSADQAVGAPLPDWIHAVVPRWTGAAVAGALDAVPQFRPDWCSFQYVPQLYGRRGLCWTAAGVPGAVRRALGCRSAVTFHEIAVPMRLNPKSLVLAAAMRAQARRLLSACDLAVTTCGLYARELGAMAPRGLPVFDIPVGTNIEPRRIEPAALSALRHRHRLEGARVFGVFGRPAGERNYPTAVRALARARLQGHRARLLVLGPWDTVQHTTARELWAAAREHGVSDDIVVAGRLSREELSAHLRLMDVFLFPQADGVSTRNTSVMAALAHGLPVVTYAPAPGNFDGYRASDGAVVKQGNEDAFVEAAVATLVAPRSSRPGPNAAYFAEHFSWSGIAARFLEALTAAAARRPAREPVG
jgi:glycosyltransferase involved in cell wall biosynthesis